MTQEYRGQVPDYDPIVASVRQKLLNRSKRGLQKYGTPLNREDLSLLDWLNHLQEEMLDSVNYLEVLIQTHKQLEILGQDSPLHPKFWDLLFGRAQDHLGERYRLNRSDLPTLEQARQWIQDYKIGPNPNQQDNRAVDKPPLVDPDKGPSPTSLQSQGLDSRNRTTRYETTSQPSTGRSQPVSGGLKAVGTLELPVRPENVVGFSIIQEQRRTLLATVDGMQRMILSLTRQLQQLGPLEAETGVPGQPDITVDFSMTEYLNRDLPY